MTSLKDRRTAAGLTLEDAAFELRLRLGHAAPGIATVSRWESGKNAGYRTNLAALMVLAHLYGCTVADLDPESGERLEMLLEQERQGTYDEPATARYAVSASQLLLRLQLAPA